MRVPALKDKFPDTRGKEQAALLLDHGDALRASARAEGMDNRSVEKNAPGERGKGAGNQLEKSGFAAGVGAENRNDFAGPRLEARGLEGKKRSVRRIAGISIADLLDGQTNFGAQTGRFGGPARGGRTAAGAHANLRRRR